MKRFIAEQGEPGVNNQYLDASAGSDCRIDHGDAERMLWGENAMAGTLQLLIFAGQHVPENGLIVHPPQGGELTVWPDGSYVFKPAEDPGRSDDQDGVATYYNYVLEDIDGETSVGVFAFHPHDELSDAMQDFQAWSLPDILDIDHGAASGIFAAGTEKAPDCGFASDLQGHADVLGLVGSEPVLEDEIAQMILNAQNT